MKDTKTFFAIASLMIASAFTIIQSVNWKVNEETYAVKFNGGKVNGILKGLKADIQFDASNPGASKISASMDVNTINTGNGMMNKHAKSEDALNAKQFSSIKFESTSVSKKGNDYEAMGKLTIKDVTKEISLPFSFEKINNEGLFKGRFSIVPKDYNVSRSGTPDKLDIELIIPVKN